MGSGLKKWKLWTPAVLAALSVLMNIISRFCKPFSDFYVNHIFPIWVETYGRLTGLFPFSVGEWMLYLAVFMAALLAGGGILYAALRGRLSEKLKKGYRRYAFFCYWVFGIVCIIMMLNCFLLYQVSPVYVRFDIGGSAEKEYGVEELSTLRDYVVRQANDLAPEFQRDERGYLLYEKDLEEEAIRQMKRLGEEYACLRGYYPRPKKLFLSGFYSQQYIMGYYFPFSMEANYNPQMYITNMPVTMCHELSHLKGFILEDEANFIGYLACVDGEDPLFRYSAYLSVLGYLDRDFIKAIGEDAEVCLSHPQISDTVAEDRMFLSSEAWEQVEKKAVLPTETVKQAADTFLDTTLTLNGVSDGTVSYSRVVDLLLQYYDGKLY